MKNLSSISRVLIVVSALTMLVSFYVPVWQILMWAPQYPEGLEMKIWLDNITGDYKIISGLNHYIGMKHIEVSMFPEFGFLKFVVAGMIGFGLLTALLNRRVILVSYVLVIILAAAAGLADFYKWGYDYGHNLDPNAPIIVPGMAYQPPLIGTKQLLNFTAFSAPDIGGYVFLVSGLIAIGVLIYEIRLKRKTLSVPVAAFLALFFVSCTASPEPLQYGKDGCHFCKMTLVDNKFDAEVVTAKGKVYKFDDANCMANFLASGELATQEIKYTLIADYAEPNKLISVTEAFLIQSEKIQSPMGSHVAAFTSKQHADKFNTTWEGKWITWETIEGAVAHPVD